MDASSRRFMSNLPAHLEMGALHKVRGRKYAGVRLWRIHGFEEYLIAADISRWFQDRTNHSCKAGLSACPQVNVSLRPLASTQLTVRQLDFNLPVGFVLEVYAVIQAGDGKLASSRCEVDFSAW